MKKKIPFLLVDTNTIALRELTDILKYVGYRDIKKTNSTSDAWAMLRAHDFGCVISAWDMPDMSGLALLRITRGEDKFFNLPFYLTDAAFTKVKVVQAGQAGVTGLLVCPFDVNNIKDKIAALTERPKDEILPETTKGLETGMELIENHKYEEALAVFENLTKQSENAEYYYNIGYIKTAQEKYSDAIAAFRKATQLDRLFAKAYEAMGRAYQQMGNPEEAQKFLQKAADIYMSKDKVENAEEILNEIMQINPDTINVYNSLGVLYRKKGDLDTALNNYLKALKVHPGESHIHYNIGRLYLEMKAPVEAKSHFAKALQLEPDFKEAREVLNALELVAT